MIAEIAIPPIRLITWSVQIFQSKIHFVLLLYSRDRTPFTAWLSPWPGLLPIFSNRMGMEECVPASPSINEDNSKYDCRDRLRKWNIFSLRWSVQSIGDFRHVTCCLCFQSSTGPWYTCGAFRDAPHLLTPPEYPRMSSCFSPSENHDYLPLWLWKLSSAMRCIHFAISCPLTLLERLCD
jgi:hypothetical protein